MMKLRSLPVHGTMSLLALAATLGLSACEKPAAPADTAKSGATPAATAPAGEAKKSEVKKDEVKMSKELWPNGKLKYTYEMRRGASGKWDRNGIGRAYYDTGELEREGTYKDGVRVGQWKYFKPDGTVDRIEERGADGKGGQ